MISEARETSALELPDKENTFVLRLENGQVSPDQTSALELPDKENTFVLRLENGQVPVSPDQRGLALGLPDKENTFVLRLENGQVYHDQRDLSPGAARQEEHLRPQAGEWSDKSFKKGMYSMAIWIRNTGLDSVPGALKKSK